MIAVLNPHSSAAVSTRTQRSLSAKRNGGDAFIVLESCTFRAEQSHDSLRTPHISVRLSAVVLCNSLLQVDKLRCSPGFSISSFFLFLKIFFFSHTMVSLLQSEMCCWYLKHSFALNKVCNFEWIFISFSEKRITDLFNRQSWNFGQPFLRKTFEIWEE